MVLILDGNSEHVAHALRKNRSFPKKNIRICDSSRAEPSLYVCTPISDLPSNKRTMKRTEKKNERTLIGCPGVQTDLLEPSKPSRNSSMVSKTR